MEVFKEIDYGIENKPKNKILNVSTFLEHFSIITYLVEIEKLRIHIPDKFEIFTITKNSKKFGLVSAVTFIDKDFHFMNLFPFLKVSFPQTNYRAYIINKQTGENRAWFFGTGIGSKLVNIPRYLWKMPWFYSKYQTEFNFVNKYDVYKIKIEAKNSNAFIDITEESIPKFNYQDFKDINEAELILTHPITGYFYRSDKKIGRYKIWHPKMKIKTAKSNHVYFEKFEKLGLLNSEEMMNPYSILITEKIEFIIDLPPKSISD